ncbi:MAG: UDP-N-acetylmuramoyl-tripeptide--D-alanyl-D-alanine ligase [Gemmatimonadota bacterium]|jgi:UDP-N-acetylmuramoyl-tripeptide--D-alanyl-D-alanine ligase|nr:UDP-N-acetylmuramoyl-tripeptide--D-alanyl-D-alanine ligase [Gemmatimonadota bacterium]
MNETFWTDASVREALGLEGPVDERAYRGVSTDTRTVGQGDLFVALVGEHFNGHNFLAAAAEAGAAGVVVSDEAVTVPAGLSRYVVPDTLTALGQLAAYRRSRLKAIVIGVAGSNGKTTTKELIRSVLSTRFRTHATTGNLNNQVGVPLTLLSAPDDAEVLVVEMGTNMPGEISILTAIVRPDHVVIPAIGEEHLELLGDLEGVLREEISVLEGLHRDGKAFVAEEPDSLPRAAREAIGRRRVKLAGVREGSDLRPDGGDRGIHVLENGTTLWRYRGVEVRLPIPGRLNVRNALLALGIAAELGIHSREAVRGLSSVSLPKLRGEWLTIGGVRVLADCYNANPPSVEAAIELLTSIPGKGRKIAVLGTMRELGGQSVRLHAGVADRIAKVVGERIDLVIATGEFGPAFERHRARLGEHLIIAADSSAAFEIIAPQLRETDIVLLKASRGDRLEHWLELMTERFGE